MKISKIELRKKKVEKTRKLSDGTTKVYYEDGSSAIFGECNILNNFVTYGILLGLWNSNNNQIFDSNNSQSNDFSIGSPDFGNDNSADCGGGNDMDTSSDFGSNDSSSSDFGSNDSSSSDFGGGSDCGGGGGF